MFPFTPNQLFDQAAARHRFLLAKAERARAVAAARTAPPPWSPRGWSAALAALVAVLSRG